MNADNRSISIGGDVKGSAVINGNGNRVSVRYAKVRLPPAETVDIAAQITALKVILSELSIPDKERLKMDNALAEAASEATDAQPNRDEIGTALDRALQYAKQAEGFATTIDRLQPHLQNAVGWLGASWSKLLDLIGLTV